MWRGRVAAVTLVLLSFLVLCATSGAVEDEHTPRRSLLQTRGQRREWRQLSAADQTTFLNAIKCLKARPRSGSSDAATWNYDQFVEFHHVNGPQTHGTSFFLPWHRWTLFQFERALKTCAPGITVPFWDYTIDSADIRNSAIWNSNTFGKNGVPSQGNCVTDGQFRRGLWAVTVNPVNNNFDPACLQRNYLRDQVWTGDSPGVINTELNKAGNFQALTSFIDYGPHGRIHNGVNGNFYWATSSPNDPLFWLVHGTVDRMWSRWQNSLVGRCPATAKDWSMGSTRSLDTALPGWPGITVRTCILTTNAACNYYYAATSADRTLKPPCGVTGKRLSSRRLSSVSDEAVSPVVGLRSLLQGNSNGNNGNGNGNGNGKGGGQGVAASGLPGRGLALGRGKDKDAQCQLPPQARANKNRLCYPLPIADQWFLDHNMDPNFGHIVQQQVEAATDAANIALDTAGILP